MDRISKYRLLKHTTVLFIGMWCLSCKTPKVEVEEYRPIIRKNPTEADVFFNRGVALSLLGRNEQAAQAFEKAFERAPCDADAYFRLGKIYHTQSMDEKAKWAYTKAFAAGPFEALHNEKGTANLFLGRYEKAAEEYMLALKVDEPHQIKSICFLAQSYLFLERYEDALKIYLLAVKLDPVSVGEYRAFINIGVAYQKLGKLDEALENYEKAQKNHPEDPDIYFNKASIFLERGEIDKVLEQAAILKKINPDYANKIYREIVNQPMKK